MHFHFTFSTFWEVKTVKKIWHAFIISMHCLSQYIKTGTWIFKKRLDLFWELFMKNGGITPFVHMPCHSAKSMHCLAQCIKRGTWIFKKRLDLFCESFLKNGGHTYYFHMHCHCAKSMHCLSQCMKRGTWIYKQKAWPFLQMIYEKCRPYILLSQALPLCKKEAISFAESVKSPCCEM